MISGLLGLVLGDMPAQLGMFSGLAFVVVLSLELVFWWFCQGENQGFAFDGLSGSMSLQFSG